MPKRLKSRGRSYGSKRSGYEVTCTVDLKEEMADLAQSAKAIRNEVAAQIRENEMLAARHARRSEQPAKSKSPKRRATPQKQAPSPKPSEPVEAEQLSFF